MLEGLDFSCRGGVAGGGGGALLRQNIKEGGGDWNTLITEITHDRDMFRVEAICSGKRVTFDAQ